MAAHFTSLDQWIPLLIWTGEQISIHWIIGVLVILIAWIVQNRKMKILMREENFGE